VSGISAALGDAWEEIERMNDPLAEKVLAYWDDVSSFIYDQLRDAEHPKLLVKIVDGKRALYLEFVFIVRQLPTGKNVGGWFLDRAWIDEVTSVEVDDDGQYAVEYRLPSQEDKRKKLEQKKKKGRLQALAH
jgi:hypothetical protein